MGHSDVRNWYTGADASTRHWVVPDDSELVSNGALEIRTLANNVADAFRTFLSKSAAVSTLMNGNFEKISATGEITANSVLLGRNYQVPISTHAKNSVLRRDEVENAIGAAITSSSVGLTSQSPTLTSRNPKGTGRVDVLEAQMDFLGTYGHRLINISLTLTRPEYHTGDERRFEITNIPVGYRPLALVQPRGDGESHYKLGQQYWNVIQYQGSTSGGKATIHLNFCVVNGYKNPDTTARCVWSVYLVPYWVAEGPSVVPNSLTRAPETPTPPDASFDVDALLQSPGGPGVPSASIVGSDPLNIYLGSI
jgi:hypothetical protein